MSLTNKSLLLACAFIGIVSGQGAVAAEPVAPEKIHTALQILASVFADMESKLTQGQLDRLPHENEEFHDGSGAMRDAIGKEAPAYRAIVKAALNESVNSAQRVADESKTGDPARVKTALDALASSMRSLNSLFPEALRVEPGSVPAPRHGDAR